MLVVDATDSEYEGMDTDPKLSVESVVTRLWVKLGNLGCVDVNVTAVPRWTSSCDSSSNEAVGLRSEFQTKI